MKTAIRALAAALLLAALASCQMPRSTGLVAPFGPASSATTSLLVAEGVPVLSLTGTVQVSTGGLRVVVTPPTGPDEYDVTHTLSAAISEAFPTPKAGTWVLRVESVSGSGQYNLRMYY